MTQVAGEKATVDTGTLLRRLALGYAEAGRSGRDDDLWAVQSAAEQAWRDGVRHGDLALLLVQLHLDCHAVEAAGATLAAAPGAAATPTGRMLRAGMLLQHGDPAAAGAILLDLSRDEPTWRSLALLAAAYEEVADRAVADLLYAEAGERLDAKQLGTLAWVECQRARLRLETGRIDGADRHLRRAESAVPGWGVDAARARWLTEVGDVAAAAALSGGVAEATGRPDHAQAAAAASRRLGRTADAVRWEALAGRGFAAAGRRWPHRYSHHLVDWHLDVTRDLAAAVRAATDDYRRRPGRRSAARLATALRAAGDPLGAERPEAEQEQRRQRVERELAAAVERSNVAVAAGA